jgi:hypothetical protein
MTGELSLKPHKPTTDTEPTTQPHPEAETTAPEPKGIILLFGRGTVVYDPGRYILIPLTAFQPHPVHQPKAWVQFLETLLRAFLLSRAQKIVLAVEKAQIPTVLALTSRLRTDKKVLPARVGTKDGKLVYFPD